MKHTKIPIPFKKSIGHPPVVIIGAYCLTCWDILHFDFDWEELQGKTMDELRRMMEYRHANHVNADNKKCKKSEVRIISHGEKT